MVEKICQLAFFMAGWTRVVGFPVGNFHMLLPGSPTKSPLVSPHLKINGSSSKTNQFEDWKNWPWTCNAYIDFFWLLTFYFSLENPNELLIHHNCSSVVTFSALDNGVLLLGCVWYQDRTKHNRHGRTEQNRTEQLFNVW